MFLLAGPEKLFREEGTSWVDRVCNRKSVPYESPVLGQLLDLISLSKINLFEPIFESYDPWNMAK